MCAHASRLTSERHTAATWDLRISASRQTAHPTPSSTRLHRDGARRQLSRQRIQTRPESRTSRVRRWDPGLFGRRSRGLRADRKGSPHADSSSWASFGLGTEIANLGPPAPSIVPSPRDEHPYDAASPVRRHKCGQLLQYSCSHDETALIGRQRRSPTPRWGCG